MNSNVPSITAENADNDRELMLRIRQEDHEAFDIFFRRHFRLIYLVAMQIVKDHAEAEDLTQDVFGVLWQKRNEFDYTRGPILSWLTTIVRNRAIDRQRQWKRHQELNYLYLQQPHQSQTICNDTPDDLLQRSEAYAELHQSMYQLPPEIREMMTLFYFNGLTQLEVSKKTQTPLGTVKARLRRGLLYLTENRRPKLMREVS